MPPRYWRASLSFNAPGEKPSRGADLDCDIYDVSWVNCFRNWNPELPSKPSGLGSWSCLCLRSSSGSVPLDAVAEATSSYMFVRTFVTCKR